MVALTFRDTVKLVLSSNSKIDKTKVFKTDYRLMQVKGIAECSSWLKLPLKNRKIKVLKTDYHLMQVKGTAECSPIEHSAIPLTCIKR